MRKRGSGRLEVGNGCMTNQLAVCGCYPLFLLFFTWPLSFCFCLPECECCPLFILFTACWPLFCLIYTYQNVSAAPYSSHSLPDNFFPPFSIFIHQYVSATFVPSIFHLLNSHTLSLLTRMWVVHHICPVYCLTHFVSASQDVSAAPLFS